MLKVIELQIEEALSADTGVWEVAWVEYPAIEEELMYFSRQKFYRAPVSVSNVACRAIKENEKRNNRAATQVGKIRAQQLCQRETISLETLKRMKSYLERAKVYNTDDWDDNGTISWKLWGGQEALDWVDSILSSIKEDMAEVGERGGIVESDKAPKSDTPNRNPEGEGTAKGKATDTRSAVVTKEVEDILQKKSDDFNERYKDKLGYGVNLGMLKSVYQRGVGAYNTSHSPEVKSSQQWALARVNAFLYIVKNGRPENPKYTGDYDLLPSAHPKKETMAEQSFVKPNAGESKDDYISRCIGYVIKEGATPEQAAGKCYGMWDNQFAAGEKISFDYNETLSTDRGKELAKKEIESGSIVYIISAMNPDRRESMFGAADMLGIPHSRVYATGSNKAKVEKINELGIKKHYDNSKEVIDALEGKGIQFDYDISALPTYDNYPPSGDTDSMMVKPFLGEEQDCGCMKEQEFAPYPWNECIQDQLDRGYSEEVAQKICGKIKAMNNSQEEFGLMGYIDGEPVFSTKTEAEIYANDKGCSGSHEHKDENGNVVYMACDTHPTPNTPNTIVAKDYDIKSIGGQENIDVIFSQEYTDEEKEALVLLAQLGESNFEAFERVVGELRGATLDQVKRRNHKTATPYYLYKKVLNGEPTREFCDSIEGRYFRRFEIDLMDGLNTQFGHNRQPYSKWNYKGGPNCSHAFYRVLAIGNRVTELGPEPGLPGTPPMNMENNGYYSEETKRKSEIAYIISQQNMSKVEFDLIGDMAPYAWLEGLPIYDDVIGASDASYVMGCGGIYEPIMYEGKQRFQACSYKAQKKEKTDALFRAVVEKKMIYTPLMLPNILIPRLDEVSGERYFVKFSPETIEKIQQKFMIEQRMRDTNYEHTDVKFQDIVMVESWLVDGESDKAYSLGYTPEQIPKGSWMAGYKVLDTKEGNDVWNKYIKTGKVKGASVEGNFLLNFSASKNDEYLLEQIINILKEIK